MQEIVKYHNDFNKIKLPSFTELEQNLLFTIIAKIRDTRYKIVNDPVSIRLLPKDLQSFCKDSNLSNRETTEILESFEKKFFQADFTIIVKDEKRNLIGKRRAHLFNEFTIQKEFKGEWNMEIGDFDDVWEEFEFIDIEINKNFNYLVEQLTANFTRFELAEFISLSGKYTKTLYRLLKQYRQTGWVQWDFKEFKDILDIPSDYEMCNIDQRILKPAIKELTQEQNLFDFGKRIPFQNLTYTKIKKGGNKVTAIRFDFKPEQIQELESQAEQAKPKNTTYTKESNLQAYCGLYVDIPTTQGQVTGKITNIYNTNEKIIMEIIDEKFNTTNLPFNNLESFEKCVKTFQI
ncbi:replication initiation protein [Helicobacter sp.]|uniref:replication initiation protein n=1 Tax=Helicobacter sp. TaxID=218 RepID=UPI00199AEBBA|nr:replication initiation protein [Helicobacter sp.]MBD5164220.1 replication initiation protein [Helicobacter sp.]MBD5164222.1 replication initiation protein [Helicobacter sp.]